MANAYLNFGGGILYLVDLCLGKTFDSQKTPFRHHLHALYAAPNG